MPAGGHSTLSEPESGRWHPAVLDVVEAVDELAYLNSILFHQSLSRLKGTGRPHQDWAVAAAPTAKGTSQNGKAPGSKRTSSSFAVSGARAASYALDETVTASSFPAFTASNVGDVGDEVRSNSVEVIESHTVMEVHGQR